MNVQKFSELSAGHALHALSPAEEHAFAVTLAAHPEWQHIVDQDLVATSGLGHSVPEVPPPTALRAQILSSIQGAPQRDRPAAEPAAITSERAGSSQASRAWRIGAFALAASVVLLTTVVFGPRILDSFTPQDPSVVALQQVENAADADSASLQLPGGGSATLHWSDAEGQAVLVADGMAPAEEGKDFELWLVRGEQAISIGLMHPDADEQSVFVADSFTQGDTVAVTIEPAGGSPSGAPTSEPILAIATA